MEKEEEATEVAEVAIEVAVATEPKVKKVK
jgi:hypothetical protein